LQRTCFVSLESEASRKSPHGVTLLFPMEMPEQSKRIPRSLDRRICIALQSCEMRLAGPKHAEILGARLSAEQSLGLLEVVLGVVRSAGPQLCAGGEQVSARERERVVGRLQQRDRTA